MQPLPDAERVTAGLAYLCRHLQEIRSTLGDEETDPATPLRKLLDMVSVGRTPDLADALSAVHDALRAAGDARGVYGNHRSLVPVGVRNLEIVYRCPLARCDGRTGDDIGDDPPTCAISGQELLRERLS